MNKKLLNKVMKKLASSNVVISPTVKSSSTSLSMQKKPETEQVQQKLEQYLLSRYHFRFNVLTEQTECCKKDADTPIYKVISQRTLNSLCLEARARHINCWDKDVSRFVNSEQMPDYHPLLSYMNTLPEWDDILTEEKREEIAKAYRRSKTVVKEPKIGRNDPCPCGSGKKYKKCCGKNL